MAVVLKKASEFATEPFDAGDGKLNLVDVIAQPAGARLGRHRRDLGVRANRV